MRCPRTLIFQAESDQSDGLVLAGTMPSTAHISPRDVLPGSPLAPGLFRFARHKVAEASLRPNSRLSRGARRHGGRSSSTVRRGCPRTCAWRAASTGADGCRRRALGRPSCSHPNCRLRFFSARSKLSHRMAPCVTERLMALADGHTRTSGCRPLSAKHTTVRDRWHPLDKHTNGAPVMIAKQSPASAS